MYIRKSQSFFPVHVNGAWFGWHAFRRGLGTRLNEAGVGNKTIQSILRHADVSTTMAYYFQPDRAASERGLRKLGAAKEVQNQGMIVAGPIAQLVRASDS